MDSLNLHPSGTSPTHVLGWLIPAMIGLTFLCFISLRSTIVTINNPNYMIGLVIIALCMFLMMEFVNQNRLQAIARSFDQNSFIFNLIPGELTYLKHRKIEATVHGVVNQLILNGRLLIHSDHSLILSEEIPLHDPEQCQVIDEFDETEKMNYSILLHKVLNKPFYLNIRKSMDEFIRYFLASREFITLFICNLIGFGCVLALALTRISLGLIREKPVMYLLLLTVILFIISSIYLFRVTRLISAKILPMIYKKRILSDKIADDPQWSYFLLGSGALAAGFAPLIKKATMNQSSGSDSSSCGTSCGSSCGGGGCGGCGGD